MFFTDTILCGIFNSFHLTFSFFCSFIAVFFADFWPTGRLSHQLLNLPGALPHTGLKEPPCPQSPKPGYSEPISAPSTYKGSPPCHPWGVWMASEHIVPADDTEVSTAIFSPFFPPPLLSLRAFLPPFFLAHPQLLHFSHSPHQKPQLGCTL